MKLRNNPPKKTEHSRVSFNFTLREIRKDHLLSTKEKNQVKNIG
jgi:hypothetical protein